MTPQDSWTTRLKDYIAKVLPGAHGHQLKGITTFVSTIIEKQTGNQAELARGLGNQEAAVKRLSRLLHNERLAIDWTIEGFQHLLVVSLVTGGRAVPIYWRAYDAAVLKGRMRRYEMAVIRRMITRGHGAIGCRRLAYCARAPHRLWVTMSRARDAKGQWELW